MTKLREIYTLQLEEIVNGYVVTYGAFGETQKEFTERRADALEILYNKAKEKYANESRHLLNVLVNPAPTAVTDEPQTEGGV